MTITRHLLNTEYAWWFGNKQNAEHAKEEILMLFSFGQQISEILIVNKLRIGTCYYLSYLRQSIYIGHVRARIHRNTFYRHFYFHPISWHCHTIIFY